MFLKQAEDPDHKELADRYNITLSGLVQRINAASEAFKAGGLPENSDLTLSSFRHMLAEQPWTCFDPGEAAAFLASSDNVKKLTENLTLSTFFVGYLSSTLSRKQLYLFPCLGCNTPVDGSEGHHGQPAPPRTQAWTQFHHAVHNAVLTMGFVRALLIWKDDRLVAGQNALADALAMPPPKDANVWVAEQVAEHQARNRVFHGLLLPNLVGLVDNCQVVAPKAALLATTLLSLLVMRRPATTLAVLDAQPLAEALIGYLGQVFDKVSNPCCVVHNWFGVADVINALPLLYHLGDWPEAERHIVRYHLPAALGTLSINLLHTAADSKVGPSFDREVDVENYPECCNVVVSVSELFEAAGPEVLSTLDANPVSFASAAVIEVLARWQSRDVPCSEARIPSAPPAHLRNRMDPGQLASYTEPLSQSIQEYLPKYQRMADSHAALAYIMPLVQALADSRKPPQPPLETSLLRGPLHIVGMRCSLLSCGASTKPDGGGCAGLARYCCAEHQKQDWRLHKAFCKRQERHGGGKNKGKGRR